MRTRASLGGDFQRVWLASAVTNVGDGVTMVAGPLLVASLTGDTATFGVSSEEGLRLALDEVNQKGVLGGRKFKVITEDDRSLPDEAKTATEKLITRDAVVAILGEIASSRSIRPNRVFQLSW